MLINTASPLLNIATEAAWQALLRCRVHYCLTWPLQGDFDEAWARPRFTLEHRTAGKRIVEGGVQSTQCSLRRKQ